jgi:hypothetical protein
MKRVIRHIRTGEFFNAGAWTRYSALAQDFPDTRELLITCAQYQLSEVELVLALGVEAPGTHEICVPLPPSDLQPAELSAVQSVRAPAQAQALTPNAKPPR